MVNIRPFSKYKLLRYRVSFHNLVYEQLDFYHEHLLKLLYKLCDVQLLLRSL